MEASIKAIARSVHGGSDSFWDLPRPRLNTLHWRMKQNLPIKRCIQVQTVFSMDLYWRRSFLLQLKYALFLSLAIRSEIFKVCHLESLGKMFSVHANVSKVTNCVEEIHSFVCKFNITIYLVDICGKIHNERFDSN